ncbi:uncharacterized protein LOC131284930 [Anopheles ziemanni]|uniref:uncharacterized protein LOC131262403 n=1 Tax=Anopheles coustani TaxID=139045 RepID=UPI002658DA57|nr:uncharacterized protein LOC131262403 [Anopheles coustani]XP_058169771.1 uncharacterized protein LOC131284930 [Anopheles ziemanni]
MRRSLLLVLLFAVVLVHGARNDGAKNGTSVGSATYLDVLRRITNLRGDDIRKNLRSLRELAIRHGLIRMSDMNEASAASNEEQSSEGEQSSQELPIEPGQQLTAIAEGDCGGRKKGGGGSNNNNIVVAGGGGGGHDDGSYSISIEEGGNKKGKKRKKGKKGKKHRKQKRKGWKKHMKKAVPIGVGLLALKALLLHFILKKLVMATAFSLLLSKKSLLVSSLIALKLLLQQPHSSDKSESSKLEVVHIPIRKDAGFHKKHQQQQKQQQQQVPSNKLKLPPAPASTTKSSLFDSYAGPHSIQHAHQQMADFGGKYIPLGYESNHFHGFDATPGAPSFGDGLHQVQNVEQFFDDADELQFDRQDNGWDGWSGWNRGEEGGKRYEAMAAAAPTLTDAGGPYGGWGDVASAPNDYQQPTGYDSLNRSRYGEILEGYVEASRRRQQLMDRRKRKF